jgi:hypothetical protein
LYLEVHGSLLLSGFFFGWQRAAAYGKDDPIKAAYSEISPSLYVLAKYEKEELA